jgi:hypothetical protein
MMTKQLIFAAVLAAAAVVGIVAPTASADPTPAPVPPYQIAGPSGPVLPGVQTYQPVCLEYPTACALRYDPDTGTWQPKGGD